MTNECNNKQWTVKRKCKYNWSVISNKYLFYKMNLTLLLTMTLISHCWFSGAEVLIYIINFIFPMMSLLAFQDYLICVCIWFSWIFPTIDQKKWNIWKSCFKGLEFVPQLPILRMLLVLSSENELRYDYKVHEHSKKYKITQEQLEKCYVICHSSTVQRGAGGGLAVIRALLAGS